MTDLPKLPDRFVEQALKCANDNNRQEISRFPNQLDYKKYHRQVKRNSKIETVRNNARFQIGEEIEQWARENISEEITEVGVSTSLGDQSDLQSPHTDATRSYVLIYLLESSNVDQDTIFWQEPGKTLRRKRKLSSYDLDVLIKIDSVRVPYKTWCYLDASILHSIENIQGKRIAVQVAFDSDAFGIFLKE
jgi:hypothetical protein